MTGGPLFARRDRTIALGVSSGDFAWRQIVRQDPCPYCCLTPRADFGKQRMTLEHVVPASKGGKHSAANIVAAHQGCNLQRSNRALLVFLLFRYYSAGQPKLVRRRLREAFYRADGVFDIWAFFRNEVGT